MSVRDAIRSFRGRLEETAADRSVPFAFGTGLFCDAARDVYDANGLRVERGAPSADELAAAAAASMEPFFHRRVTVEGSRPELLDGFARLDWEATAHLVMALRRPPDRSVDTAAIVELPFERLAETRRLVALREPWADAALADQLDVAKRRVIASVPTRFFAAVVGDEIAAYCELRGDGRVAQVEDVNTLVEFRGRGLGRALVQRAVEEARSHEVVFVEALADDWPRQLYARLGFDTVDERQLFTLGSNPLARIVLRTPRLELRLATRAELRALAAVARAGIHDPHEMPFAVPWTDRSAEPTFDDDFVAYHDSHLAGWAPESWTLELVAFHEGRPVGAQSVRAETFAERRAVATGSWLGRPWQRRGLGTEMRTAALAFAFGGLGAETARSGAMVGNAASLTVSERLGYRRVGTSTASPRGAPVAHHDLELRREEFTPPVDVRIEGLDPVRDLFGPP